jgi:Protein of unknown function (DUF2752)
VSRERQRSDHWVRLAPLLALLALLLAAALPTGGIGWILCPVRTFTGVPCAGCGLTRSVIRAARGEWVAALRLHPLGPILCLGLLGVALSGLLPCVWRDRLRKALGRPVVLQAAGLAAIGALLVNELFRLVWIFAWHRPSLW